MNKLKLLPRLALNGIRKNGSTYFPYMLSSIFSVFIFFVFSSIIFNDLMNKLPHQAYLAALMGIGLFLLGVILVPFMLYTNSFLIKRRKMELGLYSILGLEKKHIGIMMVFETIFIFTIVLIGGIVLGVVFSKLMFLVLLNLTGMPVTTEFSFSFNAFKLTLFFFLGVNLLNLFVNLIQVFKSNPNDLMKGSKSGEKEPKRLWITAVLGVVLLALGYSIAINSQIGSEIFIDFLLAVLLVVIGTHLFFTAGVIAVLRLLKKKKSFYYSKLNFTTISGMLYRMKKSAASLANICIFSTMTIITLLCTVSLWLGTGGILDFQYPFDFEINYKASDSNKIDALNDKISELSQEAQVSVAEKINLRYIKASVIKEPGKLKKPTGKENPYELNSIKLITLKVFNELEKTNETLEKDELLVYSTGRDIGYNRVTIGDTEYKVKNELQQTVFEPKSGVDSFGAEDFIIVKDEAARNKILTETGNTGKAEINSVRFRIEGEEEKIYGFSDLMSNWLKLQNDIDGYRNGISGRDETASMNGGLLFLGIFFGIIFSMCLLLIMYYKQITEGYDDRDKFSIMQKVGMSDREVRGTIKRQILLVFFLPLVFAILHTMAGFGMVTQLLSTLNLFNKNLMIIVTVMVSLGFALLYGISYVITSKTYYKLVKQMN